MLWMRANAGALARVDFVLDLVDRIRNLEPLEGPKNA
jgi:hypothetical protein